MAKAIERNVISFTNFKEVGELCELDKGSPNTRGLYFVGLPQKKSSEFLVFYIGATNRSFKQRLGEHFQDLQNKDKNKATRWQQILFNVELGSLRALCYETEYPFFFEKVLLHSNYFTTLLNIEYVNSQDIAWSYADTHGLVTKMDFGLVEKYLLNNQLKKATEQLQKVEAETQQVIGKLFEASQQ